MSILIALLIGIALGVGAGWLFHRNGDYMLIDLVVSISGSLLGMTIYFFAHLDSGSGFFSAGGLVSSVVCAAIFIAIYQLVLKIPKHKKVDHH